MFNPERLLAGLLRGGMRRNSGVGLSSLLSGGAALGLVGVAMEAAEHFMNRPGETPSTTGAPPMPPPAGTTPSSLSSNPPSPPPPGLSTPGPPPIPVATITPPPLAAPAPQVANAVVLIQAMIAAANADGTIDAQERSGILEKLEAMQLTGEEHRFIIGELIAPKAMDSIVAAVTSPDMARQVYLVSLLAVAVDTDAERHYLKKLSQALNLDHAVVADIHRRTGVPLP